MKDINNLKNYREKYKRYYGIEFGSDYVVHHIDGDRSNNDISNLVLLPAKLHSKYHFQKQIIESQRMPTQIRGNFCGAQTYYMQCLEEFMETLRECDKWHDYKMYLDGCIPNIHGIEL